MKNMNPKIEYKIKIGENILSWRRLKGIKQEDLVNKIGLSPSALSNIENGISTPNIKRLEDISNALEIEVSQLLKNPQEFFSFNNSIKTNGS